MDSDQDFAEEFEANPEATPPSQYALEQAVIGDVLLISVDTPLPDGWRECDGSPLRTAEWPEFAERTQIRADRFALPRPTDILPGHRFIVKLGTYSPCP